MEQRPLRLGDIVDDYCPRERRITNHAIVAIVGDAIKQTRCTTCDHEHVYKEAKAPRRRKKDETSVLYSQVLSGLQKPAAGTAIAPQVDGTHDEHDDDADSSPVEIGEDLTVEPSETLPVTMDEEAGNGNDEADAQGALSEVEGQRPPLESAQRAARGEGAPQASEPGGVQGSPPESEDEIWPMHRRLIRAQLPRTGNEPPPPRPLPEFTVRQPGARGQRQWGRGGNSNGNEGRGGHGQGGGGHHRGGRGGRFPAPRPDGPRGRGQGGGRGRRSR